MTRPHDKPNSPGAPSDAARWQRRLAELARRHRVPGAQLGILAGDEITTVAHGVLNVDTGQPVTTNSVFQIGSITKVWTATIVMQLVDEGHFNLDTPVLEVLPELRVSDREMTARITIRHLLTHTSGLDGDVLTDTGRGDDCLAKYVDSLVDVGLNHSPGAIWSYCNTGWSVLGRVIEKVTGQTWDTALRRRLIEPLGLTHTVTLPEEAILFGAAVGHVSIDDRQRPTPVWELPRSAGPAGLIKSTAADVLEFARLHLRGGTAPGGAQLLTDKSVAAMSRREMELPTPGESWGLGWARFAWGEHDLVGHDGATLGQAGFLRLLPKSAAGQDDLAVVVLGNGGDLRGLQQDLFREIFSELAGVEMAPPFSPPEPTETTEADITPYVGTYAGASARVEVLAALDGHGPALRTTVLGPLADAVPNPVEKQWLVAVGPGRFATRQPNAVDWTPVIFYELEPGQRCVHIGLRSLPRVR